MTTPRERDDVVERLLKRMQVDASAPPGADCVDAELLARWAENDLSGGERGAVIAHAAACARCQQLLSTMIRTEPAMASAAPGRSPWGLVRWSLPLAAAAALALWFAVDRDVAPRRAAEEAALARSTAPAVESRVPPAASNAAETPRSAVAVPPADATPKRDARPGERRARADARKESALADAAAPKRTRESQDAAASAAPPFASTSALPQTAPPPAPAPEPGPPVPSEAAATPPAAPAPSPAPPPPPPAPQTSTETQVQTQTQTQVQRQTRKERSAPPQPATEQIPGGGLAETVAIDSTTARSVIAQRQGTQATWITVTSPDPLVHWRFTRRGDVERSIDGGLSWMRERIPGARVDLLAAAAPSSSVCWLGGRDGIVLRFTTAQGWQRVPLPMPAHVVSIEATDAQNATVRAPGARFTTKDGGKTWQ